MSRTTRVALAPIAALSIASVCTSAGLAHATTGDSGATTWVHASGDVFEGRVESEPTPIVHTISRAGQGRPMRASGGEGTDATVDLVGQHTVYTFDTPLPEGVYRVEVSVEREDDAGDAPTLTVDAEARRRVLPAIPLTDGASESCTVWRISPRLSSGALIRMTGREMGKLTYDDSLTLSIMMPATAFVGTITLTVTPIPDEDRPTTIFLAGDSTVTDQPNEPWSAWGAILPSHLDDGIAVANLASSGRSLRSFRAERRLDKLLELMREDDWVMIQFAHNDQKETGDGIGPYLSFTEDLSSYAVRIADAGGRPVLVTPVVRRRFDTEGNWYDTLAEHADAVRKVAGDLDLPLIDLHAMSRELVEELGPEPSKALYVHRPADPPTRPEPIRDDTHFSVHGAMMLAERIVGAISETPSLEPIGQHLRNRPGSPAD